MHKESLVIFCAHVDLNSLAPSLCAGAVTPQWILGAKLENIVGVVHNSNYPTNRLRSSPICRNIGLSLSFIIVEEHCWWTANVSTSLILGVWHHSHPFSGYAPGESTWLGHVATRHILRPQIYVFWSECSLTRIFSNNITSPLLCSCFLQSNVNVLALTEIRSLRVFILA